MKSWRRGAATAVALLAIPSAWALGFGEPRSQAILGQPLSLAVPVQLGEGETLSSECARAEVTSGDNKLQSGLVRLRVTQGRDSSEAIVRVATTVPLEEPVVTVVVGAGCPTRISREFVLLADPPLVTTTTPPAIQTAPPPIAEPAPVRAAPPAPQAEAPRRATRPLPPTGAARAGVTRETAGRTASGVPTDARARQAARPAPRVAAETRPRLQLDAPTVAVAPPTAAAAAASAVAAQSQAASAALASAEAAASAAERRMREMEAELAKLRSDAKAQTDAMVALRTQISQSQAQQQRQTGAVPYLAAAAGVLALVAGWLAWRLKQQQAVPARDAAWWDRRGGPSSRQTRSGEDSQFQTSQHGASQFPSSQAPSRPTPLRPPPAPPTVFEPTNVPTRTGALDSMMAPPTMPAPAPGFSPSMPAMDAEASHAMSVDEQIDLEQQADFFIALGHDEAAIDLLMAHLRSTGGGTPLPFLKLLEIHRRRGDREAYERTRVRFNQRFNSVAPDWNTDPKSGRSLEDYAMVIGRLQRAWPMPLDAMAELEALLFRRGTGAELFDLPAYQEVLFLYQLARDVHMAERPPEAGDTDVDVLLPIGAAATALPPGAISLRPEFGDEEPLTLDLDLTSKTTPEPVVDELLKLDLGGDAPSTTAAAGDLAAPPGLPDLSLDALPDAPPPDVPPPDVPPPDKSA